MRRKEDIVNRKKELKIEQVTIMAKKGIENEELCNYIVIMKASIIKIGNSKGIRIPKPVLDQCGFKNTVNLEVKEKKLLVYSDRKARDGWEDEFRKRESETRHKPEQLNDYFENEWDSKEWEW